VGGEEDVPGLFADKIINNLDSDGESEQKERWLARQKSLE
jgi:hypothetical protein